jgi:hypothetical protein
MKQKKRHQSPGQGRSQILLRIAEAAKKATQAPWPSSNHEAARAEQIIFAPSSHDITEIDETQ